MNPNKSKDFKPTQSTEEVMERINALHGYVIDIDFTSVQPKYRSILKVTTKLLFYMNKQCTRNKKIFVYEKYHGIGPWVFDNE